MTASDGDRLRAEQYASSANLSARLALHQRFGTNPYGWYRWVFDRVLAYARRDVLEVGCGPATLWQSNRERLPKPWRLTLSDFSVGMVGEARAALAGGHRHVAFTVLDVASIPFGDASFDCVVANHMLYHVADRANALREIGRILRQGGCLIAATNGARHLAEIDALARRHGFEMDMLSSVPFTLDNGEAQLRRVFGNVTCERYDDSLRVTEAEALVEYVLSTCRRDEIDAAAVNALRSEAEASIKRNGFIHISKDAGLFRATFGLA